MWLHVVLLYLFWLNNWQSSKTIIEAVLVTTYYIAVLDVVEFQYKQLQGEGGCSYQFEIPDHKTGTGKLRTNFPTHIRYIVLRFFNQ